MLLKEILTIENQGTKNSNITLLYPTYNSEDVPTPLGAFDTLDTRQVKYTITQRSNNPNPLLQPRMQHIYRSPDPP